MKVYVLPIAFLLLIAIALLAILAAAGKMPEWSIGVPVSAFLALVAYVIGERLRR